MRPTESSSSDESKADTISKSVSVSSVTGFIKKHLTMKSTVEDPGGSSVRKRRSKTDATPASLTGSDKNFLLQVKLLC